MTELPEHEPTNLFLWPFGGSISDGADHLVNAQQTRYLPAATTSGVASSYSSRKSLTIFLDQILDS